MDFEQLMPGDEKKLLAMSAMATEIVREHFDPIIGKAQNDYMIEKFQSPHAIKKQLQQGYCYYFVFLGGQKIGFLAFCPKGSSLYLSKLYLYKDYRGKGYSKQMLAFVIQAAREYGFSSIELNVNRNNSAVQVYKNLGFQLLREEKNDIGSGFYMDDLVFSLTI